MKNRLLTTTVVIMFIICSQVGVQEKYITKLSGSFPCVTYDGNSICVDSIDKDPIDKNTANTDLDAFAGVRLKLQCWHPTISSTTSQNSLVRYKPDNKIIIIQKI